MFSRLLGRIDIFLIATTSSEKKLHDKKNKGEVAKHTFRLNTKLWTGLARPRFFYEDSILAPCRFADIPASSEPETATKETPAFEGATTTEVQPR